MDKHAVSTDRVVNINETSCRLLPVHRIGWRRRGVKQAQLQGNTREATTFTVALSMDRGPLDMLLQIVHAGTTGARSSRHVRGRLGNDDHGPRGLPGRHAGDVSSRPAVLHPIAQHFVRLQKLQELHPEATTTLARSVIDVSFDDVVMNKARRRQSSAERASRPVTDCENRAWTAGWHRLRARSDVDGGRDTPRA